MNDANPQLSKLALAYAALGTVLNLISSIRHGGTGRALVLLGLGIGLPAAGELLATGPLKLLRHRTRPRLLGIPIAILLGWYCAVAGSLAVAERVLGRVPLGRDGRRKALPAAAALVGTSLDLVLDPAGLDAGLWEWNLDGFYAPEIEGPNGRRGVPLVNYLGWLGLIWAVAHLCGRDASKRSGRTPILVLLPYYLAAAAWAVRARKVRYVIYSLPFPVALILAAGEGGENP